MDATPDSPGPGSAGPFAELVAQNGPARGTRRPLAGTLALLGRAAACDVRLDAEGVAPLHCAVAAGPAGPVLRDVGALVRHPRQLRGGARRAVISRRRPRLRRPVRVPRRAARAGRPDSGGGRGGPGRARVQAAAVVAQQAELTADEGGCVSGPRRWGGRRESWPPTWRSGGGGSWRCRTRSGTTATGCGPSASGRGSRRRRCRRSGSGPAPTPTPPGRGPTGSGGGWWSYASVCGGAGGGTGRPRRRR